MKRERGESGFKFFVLGVVLLSVFTRVQAYTLDPSDQRSLYIEFDGLEQIVSVQQLVDYQEPELIDVYDIDFNAARKYWAIDLVELLAKLGHTQEQLEQFKEISFVCEDGYTVNSELSLLFEKQAKPYLALASASDSIPVKDLIGGRWEAYQQGAKTIGFDPFYLIWLGDSPEFIQIAKTYPWPYQLAKLKVSEHSNYLAIAPARAMHEGTSSAAVKEGFNLYTRHCIRCHQIRGLGGSLGPDILRDKGMLDVLNDTMLSQLITDVTSFYPVTAMPNFSDTLSKQQSLNILSYLRLMKSTSSTVPVKHAN